MLLAVVGAVAFLVGATLSFLRTERGGQVVKELALPRVNERLAGNLVLRHFAFKGNEVVLDDVLLKDPEGAVVAQVAMVRVSFSPVALLRGHVVLREVAFASPTLTLRQDERGLNLGRALAPRNPEAASEASSKKPSSRDDETSSLRLSLDRFVLTDGTVDFLSTVPGVARHVGARGLTAEGSGSFAAGPATFSGHLALGGELVAPLTTALAMTLDGHGRGDDREAEAHLSLGEHGAVALRASTRADGTATVRLGELEVAPSLVRAFAPDVPLTSRVRASGEATLRGQALGVDAVVRAGGGAVTARGTFDLAARRARSFAVRGTDLDLGAVLEGLPRSRLGFALDGAGGGRDLATATGHLRLTGPRGRLGGRPVGPIDLALAADGTEVRLERLEAEALGVRVSGQGTVAQRALVPPTAGSGQPTLRGREGAAALSLMVEAKDLHACERAMLQDRAATLPLVSGRGQLDIQLQGRAEGPRLTVNGRFPALAIDDKRFRDLRVAATVPDLGLPTVFSVEAALAGATFGERSLRGLAVHAASSGSRLDADLRLAGPGPTVLSLGGRWAPDHRAFTLDGLALRSPEATWRAARPIAVVFRADDVAVKGLDLRAGAQRVKADVSKRGDALDATVAISRFDLGRLPRALVPASTNLGGRLDVDARARGRTSSPAVDAQIRLEGGSVQQLRDLSLALDAHYGRGRASGRVSARGLSTSLEGRFDVPATWPFAAGAPLSAELSIGETKLAALAKALGRGALPVDGLAHASLHLEGRAGAPEARLVIGLRKLVARGQELGDVTAELASPPRGPLKLALALALRDPKAEGPAGAAPPGTLTLTLQRSLGQLLAHPPSADELAHAPLDVDAELPRIPLVLINAFLEGPPPGGPTARGATSPPLVSAGHASLRLHAHGPALALQGALNVQAEGAAGPKFPATDGRLDLAFGAEVRAAAQLSRQGRVLAWTSGVLALPTARLADERALASARLQAKLGVGPVTLRHLGTPQLASNHPPPTLDARASASASLEGTLRAPTLTVDARVADARFGGAPVGNAEAHLRYAARKLAAVIGFRSPTGGHLDVRANAEAELGYPFDAKKLAPEAIPFDAQATAGAFDLAWLSGLSPTVQQIAGTLAADVRAHGSFGDPVVAGKLAWTNGRLVVTDLGRYRNINAKVHGDESTLVLDELTADSRDGHARVTAKADHQKEGGYAVHAQANLQRFPLYAQGQNVANLGIDLMADATWRPGTLTAKAHIDEAHVELTDAKRKDLQPLERPHDVVLLDDGAPVDEAEAQRLAKLTAAWKAAAREDAGDEPDDAPADDAAARTEPPAQSTALTVTAPRNLWVKGKDANLELGLGNDFRVISGREVRVLGEVFVRRGRVDILGRRFDLRRDSTLQFVGDPRDPLLDVAATHTNDKENVTVVVTAKGPLHAPKIAVTSPEHPELTETQLYTLIVTGRLELGGNSAGSASPSTQAASLLGGVVASQLQKALSKKLPLDVLTIESGTGLTGSRLEAGTYLSDKAYVGYVGRVGADPALLQNRNAVHLEYQLSRRWSFDGEYGDVGTGTADLMWTKHY